MEHIYLQGSEQVQEAGRSIRSASEEMKQAALNIDGALERHQRFLDDWLLRLEQVLNKNAD